ncbi:MAG: hypothetical protein HQM09_19740 [Candidatus Riflebacteria bacterium]|nr:hypothetical protein [Candidatus Riflebacteria bacterium]
MEKDELQRLVERLHKIERLYQGTNHHGERTAAKLAMERVQGEIEKKRRSACVEMKFTFQNKWQKRLFFYLLKKYGIAGYRYSGQRHSTVMAKMTEEMLNDTISPQFRQLNEELENFIEATTDNIISRAFGADSLESEVSEEETGS